MMAHPHGMITDLRIRSWLANTLVKGGQSSIDFEPQIVLNPQQPSTKFKATCQAGGLHVPESVVLLFEERFAESMVHRFD
jgi:hypothetical protein